MKLSARCPCCSNIMLHYLSNRREYWFCRTCWQEMPNLKNISQKNKYYQQNQIIKLLASLSIFLRTVASIK